MWNFKDNETWFSATTQSLHTAVEPAVRAAVKTLLSYGNDTIIVFFFEANKNKDNAIIALNSSNN